MPTPRRRPTPSLRGRASRPRIETDRLDAEDIALARLQAKLRETEALQRPPRRAEPLARATVRLPAALLARLRGRARREGRKISEVLQAALERYL